jgi:hypothetical protein
MDDTDLDSQGPFDRLVLLTVVEAAGDGALPVRSYDVRKRCEAHLDDLPAFDSGVSRERVIRALDGLVEVGALGRETVESPVGKGRPGYVLETDAGAVLSALDGDERVAPVVTRLRAD